MQEKISETAGEQKKEMQRKRCLAPFNILAHGILIQVIVNSRKGF